ncbi:MAG TPA: lipoate--protein ligase family protein [candidate division WOR-3 bacterium]|uniref:Lipoate--protein ligase family protein n=1 Tax=candidate division WOR-3 bacterium TaxID=2052148 RepID=A0A7C1BJM2_UNCW3|nr:lipoate--protein ligase family protein [candidate division WOR-3 bacterium]
MYLFDLGELPWEQSMLIFHTLARMGVEGLSIVWPDKPFISIGYFQDAELEVDLDYCRREGLPVFRREVGGGTVYLDRNQIFYHVIWNRNNPKFPKKISEVYQYLSVPPIETYGEFGIKTEFREVNDIVTREGRKIAGLGGSDIGESMVFVGSVILDFDYDRMSKAIKVPDEKFRDKVFKTMKENVTTMKRELGIVPPRSEIVRVLREKFEKVLGRLEPVELDEEIVKKMTELARWFNSPEFLYKKTPKIPRGVKIKEGIEILYGMYKARGGLIRTAQEVEKKTLKDIVITGDFTLYPKESLSVLEEGLKNTERERSRLITRIEEFYEKTGAETPGVEPEDITKAIESGT